jgi:hypothetical protein
MKIRYAIICLAMLPVTAHPAALPFTSESEAAQTGQVSLTGKIAITSAMAAERIPVAITLTSLSTGDVLTLSQGEYQISAGQYELQAYIPTLDGAVDESYQRYQVSIDIGQGESEEVTIPILGKRRSATWHDYFTISLQMAMIGDDYEVSGILNEFYTQQNIANNFPAINAISDNDSDAQDRTGISLNYKHFFADSDWMFYADYFIDQDSNNSLNRSGFGLGAGKYWDADKSSYWVAGGVGSETAAWDNITVGGNSSVTISGEADNETFDIQGGIIYRPFNLSASAKLDVVNQSVTFNIGYAFGGRKQGYIDPAFAQ